MRRRGLDEAGGEESTAEGGEGEQERVPTPGRGARGESTTRRCQGRLGGVGGGPVVLQRTTRGVREGRQRRDV